MDFLTVFLIGLGLSMDCFAVSITSGVLLKQVPWKLALKMAIFFGGFQALMPIAGWALGTGFQKYVESFDHWVAFFLLAYLGGKMIYEGIKTENAEEPKKNPMNTRVLTGLAIATSIDALAVGISFAFLNISIIAPVISIGVITFLVSIVGIVIGTKFGQRFNFPVEIFGGLILIAIGVKILVEHLFY